MIVLPILRHCEDSQGARARLDPKLQHSNTVVLVL